MKPHAQVRERDPIKIDDGGDQLFDNSNYLDSENGGILGPGCMLECCGWMVDGAVEGVGSSNSGILVCHQSEKRLTVAAHMWASDDKVYHGNAMIVGGGYRPC